MLFPGSSPLLAAVLILPGIGPAAGQTHPHLARLIEQLGDKDFKRREAASKALEEISEPALEALRRAASSSPDAEIRKRSASLVRRLDSRILEATTFAQHIFRASQLIRREYVREIQPGKLTASAIEGLYRRAGQKLAPDLQRRLENVDRLNETAQQTLLRDARFRLEPHPALVAGNDIDRTLEYLITQLDPNCAYRDAKERDRVVCRLSPQYQGIGVRLRIDPATQRTQIVTPLLDSPAYRAGLRADDLIVRITKQTPDGPMAPPEVIDTRGLTVAAVSGHIGGPPGSGLRLTVQRPGQNRLVEVDLVRGPGREESVLGHRRHVDDRWNYWMDSRNRIGYIRLTRFDRNTHDDLSLALQRLRREGVQGLILDLRCNPGWLFQSSIDCAELFIDSGLIVTVRPRHGPSFPCLSQHPGKHLCIPMACLINGGSAGASEILAACLQDHRRAIIIGERSQGKGSVQNIHDFRPTGGEIQLTTALFWRPSGGKLDRCRMPGRDDDEWGVTPDNGYFVGLTPSERDDLAAALEAREIIPHRDRPLSERRAGVKDRQLELALNYVRSQLHGEAATGLAP